MLVNEEATEAFDAFQNLGKVEKMEKELDKVKINDKKNISANNITNALAQKKLEQNLKKADAVDHILDSVYDKVDKRNISATKIKNAMLNNVAKNKKILERAAENELIESNKKLQELIETQERKELEEQINQFDGDNKFPSSFESLLNAYS